MDVQTAMTLVALAVRQFGDNDTLVLKKEIYDELADDLRLVRSENDNGDLVVKLVER